MPIFYSSLPFKKIEKQIKRLSQLEYVDYVYKNAINKLTIYMHKNKKLKHLSNINNAFLSSKKSPLSFILSYIAKLRKEMVTNPMDIYIPAAASPAIFKSPRKLFRSLANKYSLDGPGKLCRKSIWG